MTTRLRRSVAKSVAPRNPQSGTSPTLPASPRAYRLSSPETFLLLLKAHDLPAPVVEYRFDPSRRWRFDYCWRDVKVAVEQDGGIWSRGRHSRGGGIIRDNEKLNAAQLAGYMVGRFTPRQMASGEAVEWVRAALQRRGGLEIAP